MKLVFYRVIPHSVLFFRDPRPFTAGEQALARLQFPPRLAPFLGVLRTKYLEMKANAENKEIPELFPSVEDELKQISIFWFSLMKDGTPLLPALFDLFTKWKPLDENRFVTENNDLKNPKVPLLDPEKTVPLEDAHYLTPKGFAKYQSDQSPSKSEYLPVKDLWEFENRVGIALKTDSKTVERSKFYRMMVARLKQGVSFLVGVELGDGIDLPDIFTTRLGGEGHIAVWEKVEIEVRNSDKSPSFREIVVLTHVPIKSGSENGEIKFEITNWCINKLDIIGGWDYKERRPKPLVQALKPGAVLSVKRVNGSERLKIYEVTLDGVKLSVTKNLAVLQGKSNLGKHYLAEFLPVLGEPDALFVVKK